MFSEIRRIIHFQLNDFEANVQDRFGASIVSEVFEPLLQEVDFLINLEEDFESELRELSSLADQINSIGEY